MGISLYSVKRRLSTTREAATVSCPFTVEGTQSRSRATLSESEITRRRLVKVANLHVSPNLSLSSAPTVRPLPLARLYFRHQVIPKSWNSEPREERGAAEGRSIVRHRLPMSTTLVDAMHATYNHTLLSCKAIRGGSALYINENVSILVPSGHILLSICFTSCHFQHQLFRSHPLSININPQQPHLFHIRP